MKMETRYGLPWPRPTGARYNWTPGYITSLIPFFLATAILASPFSSSSLSETCPSFFPRLAGPAH